MDGNPNIQRAYEAILKHDFEQAIEWFEKAITEEPDNASYHYRLSISFARSNKLGKAVEHAESACRLDSEAEHYRLHLNTLIAKQLLHKADELLLGTDAERLDEAIYVLRRAVQLDPLSVEALVILAIAYERANRLDEAASAVIEAIKLEPGRKEAMELLQQLSRRLNGG